MKKSTTDILTPEDLLVEKYFYTAPSGHKHILESWISDIMGCILVQFHWDINKTEALPGMILLPAKLQNADQSIKDVIIK